MKADQTGSSDHPADRDSHRSVTQKVTTLAVLLAGSFASVAVRKVPVHSGARAELYDQSVDPLATHNLAPDSKAIADTAAVQLADPLPQNRSRRAETTKLECGANRDFARPRLHEFRFEDFQRCRH